MLCHTNLFTDERLKVAIDNDVVTSDITNVNWVSLVQSDALLVNVDLIFTTVCGQMLELIPHNVVLAALESSDVDILEYLRKGDGDSNIFAQDNLFHYFSHVSLQSLDVELEAPGQIPVVGNCPKNIVKPTPEVLGEPLEAAAVPNVPIPLDNDFGDNEGNIDNGNNNEGAPEVPTSSPAPTETGVAEINVEWTVKLEDSSQVQPNRDASEKEHEEFVNKASAWLTDTLTQAYKSCPLNFESQTTDFVNGEYDATIPEIHVITRSDFVF